MWGAERGRGEPGGVSAAAAGSTGHTIHKTLRGALVIAAGLGTDGKDAQ